MAVPAKKKCRQYNPEYIQYGFIPSPKNEKLPMCLVCDIVLSNEAMKPSRLRDHLQKKHPEKAKASGSFFEGLKTRFEKRNTVDGIFNKTTVTLNKGLRASYTISLLIAKAGKAHTIGETLIKPAVAEVISTILGQDPNPVLRSLPLSNDTVSRRIDEMGKNVETQLCDFLRDTRFSIQVDEATIRDNEALLMCYVRFIKENRLVDELLFVKLLETDTKGESIFRVTERFFNENNIPMTNIMACATDGSPSMVGRQCGFMAYLKQAVPGIFTIHCVIHRHHLAAKKLSGKLNESLNHVIKAVNKIKSRSMNDRIFRKLCHENNEEYERLLLHTEVRWLSKGNCLDRFHTLFGTVVEVLEAIDPNLHQEISGIQHDVAYLADIFAHLNSSNKMMQGDKITLIQVKSVVGTFIAKLELYREQIERKELFHFPRLASLSPVPDQLLHIYCEHLGALKDDMNERFHDLTSLIIPSWIIDPFKAKALDVQNELQDELIALQNDIESKECFFRDGYKVLWVEKRRSYPQLWQRAEIFITAFPTSYLVERGFSAVLQILTKQRNRLDITNKGDLRLLLTDIEPQIELLMAEHQAQTSH